MNKLKLAVIGVGHLGKEHARILASLQDAELVGVVDGRAEQAEAIAQRCGCRSFLSHQPLLELVDAAVIATPTCHHHAVARDFLSRGLSLLVEKPLTPGPAEADELVRLARGSGAVLQVGHIERFNPAFEELRRQKLRPRRIHCRRLGPFTGRSLDVGATLDLMIHDLDLVLDLVGAPVASVSAQGFSLLGGHEDTAWAQVNFAGGCVAWFSVSRVHHEAVRQTEVWADEAVVQVDYQRKTLTIRRVAEPLRQLRAAGGPWDADSINALKSELHGRYLQLDEVACDTSGPDQLTRELLDFIRAVRSRGTPRVTGEQGRDAVRLAWQITEAMRLHTQPERRAA